MNLDNINLFYQYGHVDCMFGSLYFLFVLKYCTFRGCIILEVVEKMKFIFIYSSNLISFITRQFQNTKLKIKWSW